MYICINIKTMETITILESEYFDLLELYKEMKMKLDSITNQANKGKSKKMDAMKFCGKISLDKDALQIQKDMRDEWKYPYN